MATPIPTNRCAFSFGEVAAAIGASASKSDAAVTSVSIDSRSIEHGALFVALRGVADGHQYLNAAARAGATAAIVEGGRGISDLPCFEVDDTLIALGELARAHLERLRHNRSLPVIAVGGAAGKTTTKELTAAVMRRLAGETLATPGNLNNRIGVPMTLFTLTRAHRAAIIECGTNQRGEIARLAHIVRPDAALVLNVDVEHTEGLGSIEGVADEEAALFADARVAVVGTEEQLLLDRVPAQKRRVTFGHAAAADVRIEQRRIAETGRQRVHLGLSSDLVARGIEPRIELALGLIGATAALNTAAAIAAGAAAWGRPFTRSNLEDIASELSRVVAVEGRLKLGMRREIVVIDDTYNSNPRSLAAALAAAREIADGLQARLVVALGDMLELGELAPAMHRQALRDIAAANPAACVLVGKEMRAAAGASLPADWRVADDSREAATIVSKLLRPRDVLLVKGSRGITMERVSEGL